MATMHRNIAVAALLLLTACSGGGLDGTYTDTSGIVMYTFKSGGKVEITTTAMGVQQTQETDYKIEEGKLKLGMSGGPQQVIAIDKGGCLDVGGLMGKMCKKTT
jgi:hypothetical protein